MTVADGSKELPVIRNAAVTDTGGRGLMILEHLCSRWGVEPNTSGKCVWCEVDRDQAQEHFA